MTTPSNGNSNHIIRGDTPCPYCGYNLRGLTAGEVQCPECRASLDVNQLLDKDARVRRDCEQIQADLFTAPVAALLLVLLVPLGFVGGTKMAGSVGGLVVAFALAGLLLVPWLVRTIRCCQAIGGQRGRNLTFAGQGLLVVMVLGALATLTGLIVAVWLLLSHGWMLASWGLVIAGGSGAVLLGARWCYRRVVAAVQVKLQNSP